MTFKKRIGVLVLGIILSVGGSQIIYFLAMKLIPEVGAFSFLRDPYLLLIIVGGFVFPVLSLLCFRWVANGEIKK